MYHLLAAFSHTVTIGEFVEIKQNDSHVITWHVLNTGFHRLDELIWKLRIQESINKIATDTLEIAIITIKQFKFVFKIC